MPIATLVLASQTRMTGYLQNRFSFLPVSPHLNRCIWVCIRKDYVTGPTQDTVWAANLVTNLFFQKISCLVLGFLFDFVQVKSNVSPRPSTSTYQLDLITSLLLPVKILLWQYYLIKWNRWETNQNLPFMSVYLHILLSFPPYVQESRHSSLCFNIKRRRYKLL